MIIANFKKSLQFVKYFLKGTPISLLLHRYFSQILFLFLQALVNIKLQAKTQTVIQGPCVFFIFNAHLTISHYS